MLFFKYLILVSTGFSDISKIDLLAKIESKYSNLETISSDVQKITIAKVLNTTKTYTGKIVFAKDKMRLDINSPSKSTLLLKNKMFTTLQYPENTEINNQVRVIKTKTNDFLSEILKGNFKKMKVYSQSTKDGVITYELLPLQPMNLKRAKVSVDIARVLVVKLSYWDNLENQTSFVFNNIETNKKVTDEVFSVTIPKDALVTEL